MASVVALCPLDAPPAPVIGAVGAAAIPGRSRRLADLFAGCPLCHRGVDAIADTALSLVGRAAALVVGHDSDA